MIAQGERKEDCTLGQNQGKDQYPVLGREGKEVDESSEVKDKSGSQI